MPNSRIGPLLLAGFLLASLPSVATARQCPDGSRPPCARAAAPALALDDRTWLILPFENTARNSEAELIRQAGLNLLYQELSRWSDVRIISDNRVDDLLRSLPEAQRSPLGLESGRALARRVGAGRVVLGDYLAVGSRAQIAAKVYDTRTGQQLRLVRERLSDFSGDAALDSLSATYSRLGAAIMGLPPRRGAGSIAGTTSMEAFRAYAAGMADLNRGELVAARSHFMRAVTADSAYALAQFRLYQIAFDTVAGRLHLAAAERHAVTLPPLERAKLTLLRATAPGAACEPASRLIELDSADGEGWLGLARCETRVRPLRELPGGAGRRLLGGNRHRATVAARRALLLDPNSIFAHFGLFTVLSETIQQPICERLVAVTQCPRDSLWLGALIPSGDSTLLPLERVSDLRGDPPALRLEAVALRRSRLEEAQRLFTSFATPDNHPAQSALALLAHNLGNHAVASRILAALPTNQEAGPFVNFTARMDVALMLEQLPGIQFDSALARREITGGPVAGMLGRFEIDASTIGVAGRSARAAWLPIVAGVLPASFDSIEAALAAVTTDTIARAAILEVSTLLAFHMRRTGPALDTAAPHPIRRFQALLAGRDTVRARATLAGYDSLLARRPELANDDGGRLFAAESHLALGDTARAWAHMQTWARLWRTAPPSRAWNILDQFHGYANVVGRLNGRMWLLYADLAASRGANAEAGRGYRMVIALWENGDTPVQPLVARARSALARLGT